MYILAIPFPSSDLIESICMHMYMYMYNYLYVQVHSLKLLVPIYSSLTMHTAYMCIICIFPADES